ncbi:MAG: zinc carboxypeptidase [Bacteroidetes bacterium]|nr:zinc carboxypeptidase [Bacteroidota bacterium]MBS1756374.1 zinc carboxypeptidase [Bacteroidota bacterium]
MKKIFLFAAVFFTVTAGFAQIKSPEQFLGYQVGTRFTRHDKIVEYFKYIASAAPSIVKLEQYGETNEHRPLYLAFVSTADNINNLENIRLNNLRLAHLTKDKMMPTEQTPAIVWLSYNVHGNEAASSEASMLTLFALVDPANQQTKEWEKNTVIVIDPCLNPDGRDRYVNWYNSMVGAKYNPEYIAREHQEPWPGGRSNHYNFDLNRDWAWQTQVESQQRVAQFNKWLPQVHVDYHEQGYNDPYYFAPAAKPYHEVLTKWQRDFQVTIGKNHAKYFDKNGWLYFTNIRFDLFYPSYGDTYPLYNGSIGMTYEQGGIRAGLGIITHEKDTLTLVDRVLHHFTTSLSTIEVSSQNASKLVQEFHTFYNNAVSGSIGQYKTYVIKNNPGDEQRIQSLMALLDKNNIQYGSASGSGKGYHYQNKKEENFTINSGDLVVTAAQPKAAMVKVLLEPQSKLEDSATYDITAWSLPYAYGLDAYATKQMIPVKMGDVLPGFVNNNAEDAYGYVIRWEGVASARTIATLLAKGVKMRFSQEPFAVNGQNFGRGSVIITKKGNAVFGNTLWKEVAAVCNENKVKMNEVNTGMVQKGFDFGSDLIHALIAPKVAMLTGEAVSSTAAGDVWSFFDNELNYKLTLINATDFNRIDWSDIDVLILPDGYYRFLNDKESSAQFKQWIEKGGRVIALENAAAQLTKQDWSILKSKTEDEDKSKEKNKDEYADLQPFENRERGPLANSTPGAIFKVDVDNTHPLMYGYPSYYYTLKMDDNVYEFMKDGGWNAGVMKKENQMSGYVGYKLSPRLKDGLLFGVQDLGNGNITYLSDNVLFRNFWENGKLMFCNAVFMVGQ